MAAGDPGVLKRNYSSVAVETTLSASLASASSGDSNTVNVAATTGFPGTAPYTLIIDPDTSKEEVVTVTVTGGTALTALRGQDGTAAVAHSAGATVRHGVSGREFKELQTHISARGFVSDSGILSGVDTHVHGIASGEGDVVGTAKAQTLSNKTFTGSFTASAATFVSPTISGSPVITGLSSVGMVSSSAVPLSYVESVVGSATSAATSATSAATSATSAAASATAAATSASSASTSASSASTSRTSAATSATSAATSATAAATSATSASTSASSALTSQTSAATSATSAANSASAASTSATSASNSASAAATSATSASNSASAAATSATSASTSASSALTSQTSAATSATSAANSASAASTSATSAATSATSAATSATSAANSATAAASSEAALSDASIQISFQVFG